MASYTEALHATETARRWARIAHAHLDGMRRDAPDMDGFALDHIELGELEDALTALEGAEQGLRQTIARTAATGDAAA